MSPNLSNLKLVKFDASTKNAAERMVRLKAALTDE